MADNVTIPLTGSGDATAIVATDEVGGAQHQYVKVEFGADGTATKVSSADPLPVTISGVATAANQTTGNTSLSSIDGKLPALGQALAAAAVPVVLTAAQVSTLTPPAAISGFATAANQDTAQTSLSSMDTKLTTIDGRVDGVEASLSSIDGKTPALGQALAAASVPVILPAATISTLTPPAAITGFATAANQTTVIGHLDGVEGILTTIDADTGGMLTALQLLDNAVSGNELQVDIVAALPTGANVIGGVSGDVAHDAADSGSPLKMGAKAVAHGANPTAVAAGDRTDLYANRHGIPFVLNGHPNVQTLRVNYTAAQTDAAIVSVAGGTKIAVLKGSVLADKANTVDVQVRIGFGAVNTPTGAGVVLTHPGIAAGSGVIEGNGGSLIGVGADGEDLRITSEVPTTGSIDVLVTYFLIES